MITKRFLFTFATLLITVAGFATLKNSAALTAAATQPVDNSLPLTAGGNTIAGPAAFNAAGDDLPKTVFNTRHQGLSLCATAVNTGTSPVNYLLAKDNGSTRIFEAAIMSGETFTACGPDATTIVFSCVVENSTCNTVWRVDQVR